MIVYIASLPHSGSTLLSLLLGCEPGVVALGEIRLQTAKIGKDPMQAGEGKCGCGAKIRDCELWGRFIAERARGAAPLDDLLLVVRIMRELHGSEMLLVDASKIREPVEELAAAGGVPVKVVHLSRDFRSWIVSAADLRRRKAKRSRPGWLLGFEGARRWVRENRKLDRAIAECGFPALRLGYEELVLAAPQSWDLLRGFLGLPAADTPSGIEGSSNHIFSGNRMRDNAERRAVSYDGRWFARDEWRAASLIYPGIGALNRRWTYSNKVAGEGEKTDLEKLAASHGFEP